MKHTHNLIGYARVSTHDQSLALQKDALHKAGCTKMFTDVAGGQSARPGLAQALAYLREGDTLVVWRLDRFGRGLVDLIEKIGALNARGIDFKSLQESIDTTTSTGKLVFHIFGSLAEFERELIRERTRAGLRAARARGRLGGRPRSLDEKQVALLHSMHKDPKNSIKDICQTLKISKTTLYRYVGNGSPQSKSRPAAVAYRDPA